MDAYDDYKQTLLARGHSLADAEKDAEAMRQHDAAQAAQQAVQEQRFAQRLERDAEMRKQLDGIPVDGAKPKI